MAPFATLRVTRDSATALRVPVDAPREVRVVSFLLRHRQVDVRPITAALEVHAARKDLLGGSAVLADQPAHVAQAVAGGEHPEGPLAEELVNPLVLRAGR